MTVPAYSAAPCANCGRRFPLAALDAKPSHFPRRPAEYQLARLDEAADSGDDFDWLECADCYGPGYAVLPLLTRAG